MRTAQCHLEREDDEAERRTAFLAAPVGTRENADEGEAPKEGEENDAEPPLPGRGPDKYGLDIEAEFRTVRQRTRDWKLAVEQAGLVMRTLLDLHYDDVHLQNWRKREESARKRMPTRKTDFQVFANVSYTHRRKPNVHVALPNRIKNVLLSVHDEKDWAKLEAVRQAIAREIEGDRAAESEGHY